jgi:putative heme iron utilization protein
MSSSIRREIARLVFSQRWAALASIDDGQPLASMVAYAAEPGLEGLLLFLSGLSQHTRNLVADGRASLVVSAPDTGVGDPQTLPRVTLNGRALVIARHDPLFDEAAARYVARFPDSAMRFGLGDFLLFRFAVADARYVGGFARAISLSGDDLREAARDEESAPRVS